MAAILKSLNNLLTYSQKVYEFFFEKILESIFSCQSHFKDHVMKSSIVYYYFRILRIFLNLIFYQAFLYLLKKIHKKEEVLAVEFGYITALFLSLCKEVEVEFPETT